jgi:hypothetical protein
MATVEARSVLTVRVDPSIVEKVIELVFSELTVNELVVREDPSRVE